MSNALKLMLVAVVLAVATIAAMAEAQPGRPLDLGSVPAAVVKPAPAIALARPSTHDELRPARNVWALTLLTLAAFLTLAFATRPANDPVQETEDPA